MRRYLALIIMFALCAKAVSQEAFLDVAEYTLSYSDFTNKKKQDEVYYKLDRALRQLGFIVIKDAPIHENIVQKAYRESRLFFDLSDSEKRRLSGAKCNYQRGYCPFRVEKAKDHFLADQKESFMLGLYPDEAYPDIWPKSRGFSKTMRYVSPLLMKCSEQCLEMMALSSGCERKTFSKYFEQPTPSTMRLVHYPAFRQATREKILAAEHTDISFISLVVCPWIDSVRPERTVRGLQVEDVMGNWVRVRIPRKSVLLRVGDLLQNLTNGYYKSAKFRIKADDGLEKQDRYAIVLYCHPQGDTDLSPLPYFIEKRGGQVYYPKATRDELLAERLVDINLASSDELLSNLVASGVVSRMKEFKMASPRVLKKMRDYKDRAATQKKGDN